MFDGKIVADGGAARSQDARPVQRDPPGPIAGVRCVAVVAGVPRG
jgi:hypothetical protein